MAVDGGRADDLEIGQALDFQRRQWMVQRVGWIAMGMVILAALAGLMGSGPLSKASAGGPDDDLQVTYQRFDRRHAPTEVQMKVAGGAHQEGEVRIWVDQAFLDRVELEQIIPEPEEVLSEPGREIYVFRAGSDSSQQVDVTYQLQQDAFGIHTARVGIVDGPELTFWQVVYP